MKGETKMKKLLLIFVLSLSLTGNAFCEDTTDITPEQRATIERVLKYGREDIRQAARKEAEQEAEQDFNEWVKRSEKKNQSVKPEDKKDKDK
jgi:hypothetical protein